LKTAILLLALLADVNAAKAITINLDPARTQIGYTLGDVLHTTHGAFKLKSGRIDVDIVRNSVSGVAVVDASSGDSGNGTRDGRMKRSILETDRYPEITFSCTGLEGSVATGGMSTVTVTGLFGIHGQQHQISIPMQVEFSGAQVVITGKFSVPYVAWGMKDPSRFILRVNETVDIEIKATGSVSF
jgi:polyisoprenoid-binding protein YceI